MTVPNNGWKNKVGTSNRSCKCGTWKQHWINFSHKEWSFFCSVLGCNNRATLGAHIYNPNVNGEWIVPMCEHCNQVNGAFSLKGDVTLVPANKSTTCD